LSNTGNSDIFLAKFNGVASICTMQQDSTIIYPNPVSDKLFIKTEVNIRHITINNELGQVVLNQDMSNCAEISVSKLQPGIYVINAYSIDGELVGKFKVVKK
jgi:hypothetical protein